jgi:hypothetical protein
LLRGRDAVLATTLRVAPWDSAATMLRIALGCCASRLKRAGDDASRRARYITGINPSDQKN